MYSSQQAWKLCCGSLLCFATAVGGYYLGFQRGCSSALANADDSIVISEAYPVGDLVIPWSPEGLDVRGNFESLIYTMRQNVRPATWDVVHGLHADEDSLSLVVTQTKAGHEEVKVLLGQLRSLHERYTGHVENGTCGYCGKAPLPEVGQRCSGCCIPRHDPPSA